MEPDLYKRIDEGLYNPGLDFPGRPSRPLLRREHDSKQIEKYLEIFIAYEHRRLKYDIEVDAYQKDRNECLQLFKKDALEYCGITDHPKAGRAFTMASEYSPNLSETLQKLEELAELLTD